jgi:hypothetical protein
VSVARPITPAPLPQTPEWRDVDLKTFREQIVPRDRPAVLKGLVGDWPVVQAGRRSPQAFSDYIRAKDNGAPTTIFVGTPEIEGLFFYRDDMTGLNFQRLQQPFHTAVANILLQMDNRRPPAIYAPAASGPTGLPGFATDNPMPLLDPRVGPKLWVSNAVTAPTHYDMHDGLACVAAGRRRFTFFPPDQLANLYVGPLDLSPGGQPTSMVKVAAPDFDRYPRYADALAAAEAAELEAGDAVFIPSMWWHNVQSLEPLNLLVNYWWTEGASPPASPFTALALGLMSMAPLDASRREVWRQMFDHYVFRTGGDPAAHLPADRRGMLGIIDPQLEIYMRTQIVRAMLPMLPKSALDDIQRAIEAGRTVTRPNVQA